jgi:hypothetical protein
MAVEKKGKWSFAEDRHLIALAGSRKSLEEVARQLGRTPEATAQSAMRLGIALKLQADVKAKGK